MRKVFGIIVMIGILTSQLNMLSAFSEATFERTDEISVKRKLNDGSTTQQDGTVFIDESIILELSNSNEADTIVTVPLGENFTYDQELTMNLNAHRDDVYLTHRSDTNSVDISWDGESTEHSASFAFTAVKESNNEIYVKVTRDGHEHRSASINIAVQGSEESNEEVTGNPNHSNNGELVPDLKETNECTDDVSDDEEILPSEVNARATNYGDGKYQSPPPESNIDMTQLFDIVPGLNSKIDSKYSNVILITGASANQNGGIYSKVKVNLEETFYFDGALYIGPGDFTESNPADGMTFVMHNDSRGIGAIGAAGESLGAYNSRQESKHTAIQNAIAAEFDIYPNRGTTDRTDRGLENRKHIAFVKPSEMKGSGSWNGGPLHQSVTYMDDLYSPNWKSISIRWLPDLDNSGGGWLLVNLGGKEVRWRTDDYESYFGSKEVYWGFTGATGAYKAVQAVAITEISLEPELEVSKDVYLNHDFQQSQDGKGVGPGSVLTYQINAKNPSEHSVSDMEYIDILPDYVDYMDGTADLMDSNGNTVESNVNITYNKDTNTLSYQSNRDIDGQETLSLRFDVKVKYDVEIGTEISNTASIVASKFTFHSNTVINVVEEEKGKERIEKSVENLNGSDIYVVGDSIRYTILLENFSENPGSIWKEVELTDIVPSGLIVDASTFKKIYKKRDGTVDETVLDLSDVWSTSTNTLSVKQNAIYGTEQVIVTFEAVIGKELGGTIVTNMAEATIDSGSTRDDAVFTVEGLLEFISAPTVMSFGNDLKISSKEEVYQLDSWVGELVVQDSRGKGNTWLMTAKLAAELTSDSGHELSESLYYMSNGQEKPFSTDYSILIYDTVTKSSDSIVISDTWGVSDNRITGPVLKVRPGQARSQAYYGAIQWNLQDVPGNN